MLLQTKFPKYYKKEDRKKESAEVISGKVEALIKYLTLQEKMDLLYGGEEPEEVGKLANGGYLPGAPRLGVPEIRMYDGPAGITSIKDTTGLPMPILLAATWDEEMAYNFGKVAASENAAVAGNCQLGNQVDTIRTPHFSRNKDMKGEDYYLSSRLGIAEVKGVQDQGVMATLKHFAAANSTGFNIKMNEVIDEQTLHQVYLRQFEDAVNEGNAASVMTTYSSINGHYATDSEYLNKKVLREMWNFKGASMSDWGANHNMTLNKGTDIEMPRAAYNSAYRILRGLRDGSITWEDVDNGARHVLYAMGTAGLLSMVQLDQEGRPFEEYGRTEPIQMEWRYEEEKKDGLLEKNAQIALEIAREGIVLAKNQGQALPLMEDDYSGENSVALIGQGAVRALCGFGQERSFGRLERMISPVEYLDEMVDGNIVAKKGIDICGEPIPKEYLYQDIDCTKAGVVRTYGVSKEDTELAPAFVFGPGGGGLEFNGVVGELDEYGELVENNLMNTWKRGSVIGACNDKEIGSIAGVEENIDCNCGTIAGKIVKNYKNSENGTAIPFGGRYTWKTYLKAPESGTFKLKLETIGGEATFIIKVGDEWIRVGSSMMREGAHWPWDCVLCTEEGMGIITKLVTLEKDQIYPIVVYGAALDPNKDLQVRVAWVTPSMVKNDYQDALDAAQKARKVVLFLNENEDESGFFVLDKEKLELPEEQMRLFRDIRDITRKEGSKLIVVYQGAGILAAEEWKEGSDAVVVTYLPGQEGARALAEILTGKVNPTGKLSHSWPMKDEDTPISDTVLHRKMRMKGIPDEGAVNVYFSEGIYFGYRWYDKYEVEPAFCFGHGISYTSYEYSNLMIKPISNTFQVECDVENVGKIAGDEIIQLYIGDTEVPEGIQMAKKQLVGFKRVKNLQPGEKRHVTMTIEYKDLCYWNPTIELITRSDGRKDKYVPAYGERKIYVGASSRDIRLIGKIKVEIP